VEPARTVSNIDFKVPAGSRRPPPVQSTLAKSSTEYSAYQRASNERNIYTRIKLLLSFEKDFPRSDLLPRVYEDLVDLYIAKGDPNTAMNYGDMLLEKEPENVWALLTISRAYGLSQVDLRAALQYGEKAVATVAKLKTLPASARPEEFHGYTAQQWTSTIASLDQSAKSNLEWVKQVITWNQNAVNAAVRSRR
jgi:tetratricopeptide (TPR) repeat protein